VRKKVEKHCSIEFDPSKPGVSNSKLYTGQIEKENVPAGRILKKALWDASKRPQSRDVA